MPNRRGMLYLVLAVISGLSAVLLARNYLSSQIPLVGEFLQTRNVVVVSQQMPAGAALSGRDLGVVDWPEGLLPRGAISDREAIRGRVLKRALQEGEPVLESALLPVGAEGGLHSLIAHSQRAVSVQVDAVIGVAGWVKPGSRVDVLATLSRTDFRRPVPLSRVILQDVRVLAIDQKLEQPDGDDEAEVVSVVTLEVNPAEAQQLVFAASEGTLQLALRNPDDDQVIRARSVSVSDLVPVASELGEGDAAAEDLEVIDSGARPDIRIEVVRGTTMSEETL